MKGYIYLNSTSNESALPLLSLFHVLPLGLPLKLKSMLLKVRPMLCSQGPLMASLFMLASMLDASAGSLFYVVCPPSGEGHCQFGLRL